MSFIPIGGDARDLSRSCAVLITRVLTRNSVLLRSLLIAFLFIGCGSDESTGPNVIDVGVAGDGRLNAVLESIRDESDLPALGALLMQSGQIVEKGAVGLRTSRSPEHVTNEDRWHIGSNTKAMTATLAAVLVEKGEISWTTTVAEVFPDLASGMRSEYMTVSLDVLLYHTSGLPANIADAPSWASIRNSTDPLPLQRRQLAAELLALQPAVPRGTHLYSNGGYLVAGSMLEEVTGRAWEELMLTELLAPLGMTSTGFGAPGSAGGTPDQPRGHVRQGGNWVPFEPGPNADNPAAIGPAGTVHTTLDDYARFMAAHLAGARGIGGLVEAETFQQLQAPAPGTTYALGWGVGEGDWAGGRFLAHAGSNLLWYAVVLIAPERDLAVFVVTNAAGSNGEQGTGAMIEALIERADAAFGQESRVSSVVYTPN